MYDVTASEIALLAKQLAKQQRTEEALSIHRLNISLYPREFGAYYEYGKYLKVTGNNEEAKKIIQKSLDLNPDNDGAKLLLSEIK
jgi:tetratricopeptide (TPR) repeat protein